MGAGDSAALRSLRHVHWMLRLVDLGYINRLAFIPPLVEVLKLLVRILLATPLVVPVLRCFVWCAVCTLDGLVVLLYSRCMAYKKRNQRVNTSILTLSDESSSHHLRCTHLHTVCVFGHVEDGAP